MRKTCLNMVFELAKRDERVVFVGSDLGFNVLSDFRERFPERFLMEGVSEAHAVGMAAGLALEGRVVYVNTIATFLSRRAFEQIAIDLCQHNVPVRLIGNGGGLVYAPLGSTHMAFEDLSILRALPNLTILAPADALEMERLVPLTLDIPGPVYIRLAKGGDPIVTRPDTPLAIGRAVPLAEGEDVLYITTGVMAGAALGAREILAGQGISAGVLHLPTLKPLDEAAILDACRSAHAVVTMEENALAGGLGDAVASLLLEAGVRPEGFRRLGLPDCFPDRYGSQADLLAEYGLTAGDAARAGAALIRGR